MNHRVMKDGTVNVVYKNGMVEEQKGTDALLGAMDADQPSLFELIEYVRNGRGTLSCRTQTERKF